MGSPTTAKCRRCFRQLTGKCGECSRCKDGHTVCIRAAVAIVDGDTFTCSECGFVMDHDGWGVIGPPRRPHAGDTFKEKL